MKLVIYETTHHETLPSILDLSEVYFKYVAVFLKETTYQNLCSDAAPEHQWPHTIFFRQAENYPNRNFIRDAVEHFKNNNFSHFHISTLDNNLFYFAWLINGLKKAHISLSVQAVNEYCVYKYKGIRDITESFAKLFFHKRIAHYRVFFPLMSGLLQKKISGSTAVFIPSRFFSGVKANSKEPGNVFKIVIPGSVDPNRRDYDFVSGFLKTHTHLITKKKPVELIILGKCNTEFGIKFINGLLALNAGNFKIKYFENYVSQSEYQKNLEEADIIWSPIHIDTVGIRGTSEVYGLSTATGLTADLLFNCKPAIVPYGFNIPEHYEDALLTYKSPDELVHLILKFMNGYGEDINSKIYQSFSFFVKENFLVHFERLMKINTTNHIIR